MGMHAMSRNINVRIAARQTAIIEPVNDHQYPDKQPDDKQPYDKHLSDKYPYDKHMKPVTPGSTEGDKHESSNNQ